MIGWEIPNHKNFQKNPSKTLLRNPYKQASPKIKILNSIALHLHKQTNKILHTQLRKLKLVNNGRSITDTPLPHGNHGPWISISPSRPLHRNPRSSNLHYLLLLHNPLLPLPLPRPQRLPPVVPRRPAQRRRRRRRGGGNGGGAAVEAAGETAADGEVWERENGEEEERGGMCDMFGGVFGRRKLPGVAGV